MNQTNSFWHSPVLPAALYNKDIMIICFIHSRYLAFLLEIRTHQGSFQVSGTISEKLEPCSNIFGHHSKIRCTSLPKGKWWRLYNEKFPADNNWATIDRAKSKSAGWFIGWLIPYFFIFNFPTLWIFKSFILLPIAKTDSV